MISIIIATRNRCEALSATLSALLPCCNSVQFPVEVIVADNGSVDRTRDVVEALRQADPRVRYIFVEESGKSRALNRAVQASRGDILVFIDDDVQPMRLWLDELTKPILGRSADVTVGRVVIPPHLTRTWMSGMHRVMLAETHSTPTDNEVFLIGANCAISRVRFMDVGGFDEALGPGALGFWEDTLLSLQLRRLGCRFQFVSEAVVEHHFSSDRLSRAAFLSRATGEGRSMGYVAWHWDHHLMSNCRILILRKSLKLLLLRILRAGDCAATEGCLEWEFKLVQQVAFFKSYLTNSKTQPRYVSRSAKDDHSGSPCAQLS